MIFSIYLTKNKNKQTKKLNNEKIHKNIKARTQQQQQENTQSNSFWHTFILNSLPKIYCDNKKLQ